MAEDYKVADGDCLSSIAFARGFFWETLWNLGENAELKNKRKDPNILHPGDVLHIPDLRLKEESCATENEYKFKLKGVPAKLKLKLMRPKPKEKKKESSSSPAPGGGPSPGGMGGLLGAVSSALGLPTGGGGDSNPLSHGADPDFKPPPQFEEEPLANADYILEVDGEKVAEGKSDGNGVITIPLMPSAEEGTLTVNKGKEDERVLTLALGGMDPVEEVSGVRKRLRNLGYFCQVQGPEDAPDLKAALKKFQEKNSLNVSGNLDDATRSKLKELHGC